MSAVLAELRPPQPWRPVLLSWGVLVVALLLLYRGTWAEMVGIWDRSDTFAHCFLVPPISAWLVWRQRARLAAITPQPQPLFALAMLPLAALWLAGDLVAVNAATQLAVVGLLVLTVPLAWGWPAARVVAFPVLFLFFAVPIGEFLTPLFMDWTADFTVAALRATGIPVYREGLRFNIPSGTWSVVEACSGVRYLIASFMVGTLFAYLNYRSNKRRLIFVAIAIAVPIVANWLRAYMIVMLGHLSGNTIAVGADHLVYGWAFFGVVVGIMFFIGARWSEPPAAAADAPGTGLPAAPPVSAPGPRAALLAMATAAGALVLPHAVLGVLAPPAGGSGAVQLSLPAELPATGGASAWRAVDGPASQPGWKPRFVDPSLELQRSYESVSGDGRRIGVHVAYYRDQNYRRKLVSGENVLAVSEDPDWAVAARGTQRLAPAGLGEITVRSARLRSGEPMAVEGRPQLLVLQAYWIDGRWMAGNVQGKLAGAWQRLRGQGDDGAMLTLVVQSARPDEGQAVLQGFAQAHWAALQRSLEAARGLRPAN